MSCVKPPVTSTPDTGASTPTGPCAAYSPARRVGATPDALLELSGLVASRKHAGIYWSHNDSGQAFELFAIREDGTIAAQIPLTGAQNIDIEDIALGPCGADTCIFLGDIGDNREVRTNVALYRLKEPEALSNAPLAVEVQSFSYTDGAHNAESLIVDPSTGTPYVITKGAGSLGGVYKVQGSSAANIGTIKAPNNSDQVSTAADVHRDSTRVLIRTYGHLWELRGTSLEQALSATPVEVPAASQIQSEAVAYTSDGRGYLVGSEGAGEGIYRVDCRD